MINCMSRNVRNYLGPLKRRKYKSLLYLLGDLARLLTFGGCLSQSARALSFLHCGGNT